LLDISAHDKLILAAFALEPEVVPPELVGELVLPVPDPVSEFTGVAQALFDGVETP
jgi:hypothetical protein